MGSGCGMGGASAEKRGSAAATTSRMGAATIMLDAMLCYLMFCYVCYVVLCYAMLCYALLCCVMLYFVVLCCVTLHVMLCYVEASVTIGSYAPNPDRSPSHMLKHATWMLRLGRKFVKIYQSPCWFSPENCVSF